MLNKLMTGHACRFFSANEGCLLNLNKVVIVINEHGDSEVGSLVNDGDGVRGVSDVDEDEVDDNNHDHEQRGLEKRKKEKKETQGKEGRKEKKDSLSWLAQKRNL